jgi:glycopeptide antibiotics resistance protein
VPLGFLVPFISERARQLIVVLIVAFSISVSFELIQVFTLLGTGDIDDVILNMLGAAVGYGIFALAVWWKHYFVRFAQYRREL